MAKKKKKSAFQKKMKRFKKRFNKFMSEKSSFIVFSVLFLILLFVGTFYLTTVIFNKTEKEPETEFHSSIITTMPAVQTTIKEIITTEQTTEDQTTQTSTTNASDSYTPGNTAYPSDTASWQLICVNRNRYVASDVEYSISLSYVAGSGERMDSRAAAAYEKMYAAAKDDGYYLTPCSGYRSYSTQKRLYNEFYYDYINQGYSSEEAHNLTSKRRNPAGSSEHNIGICMDIICAASSANFQNTDEYVWLCENAADYGFILRYPEDKVDVTGVKFEPWHWRYVGVDNAHAIKNSGLCLEEYLGIQ